LKINDSQRDEVISYRSKKEDIRCFNCDGSHYTLQCDKLKAQAGDRNLGKFQTGQKSKEVKTKKRNAKLNKSLFTETDVPTDVDNIELNTFFA
jgi:hypothetical protein